MGVYDECCSIGCGSCKYFQVDADRREDTTCKRIDHKKIKFSVPWFKSYDCGQLSQIKCADFEPKESSVWLYNHWTTMDDYMTDLERVEGESVRTYEPSECLTAQKGYMSFTINGNTDVRYYVKSKDFYNNTFKNADGTLKWIKRCYYKQSRKSCIGYELVWEFNKEVEHDLFC